MNTVKLSPTTVNERSQILDIIRGFALFGIFANNIIVLSTYGYTGEAYQEQLPTVIVDRIALAFQFVFVEGKFYTLFSLLFGIGFSIILTRNVQKGNPPYSIFYRRLFVLMLFGLAHLLLLWEGDILFMYAMVGLLLPLFRRCTDRALLIWAGCLILSPILIDTIRIILHWSPGEKLFAIGQQLDIKNGVPTNEAYASYLLKEGSGYREVLKWCQSGFFYRYQYILDSNRIPKVLGVFLIGFYAGRKNIYANEEFRALLLKVKKWGFIIGIPFNILMLAFFLDKKEVPDSWWGLADSVSYALGVVPLALAYASSMLLWYWKKKGNTRWNVLAPMGRMALTNYIAQTLFAGLIFYNIGFGVGPHIGYAFILLIALAICCIQVAYSHIWFRYFNYGPLEWIWRQLTYGKRLPLRKKSATEKRA